MAPIAPTARACMALVAMYHGANSLGNTQTTRIMGAQAGVMAQQEVMAGKIGPYVIEVCRIPADTDRATCAQAIYSLCGRMP